MNEAEMIPLNSWLVKLLNGGEQLFHWGFFTEEETKQQMEKLTMNLHYSQYVTMNRWKESVMTMQCMTTVQEYSTTLIVYTF